MAPPEFVESVGAAQAALGPSLMDIDFARADNVASRLFEEERRFTEMCAESARAADLVGGVDDAYARVRDMAFETVRAVEVALADDAVSKLFEEERRFTEMCAESARAVDLIGGVDRAYARVEDMAFDRARAGESALFGSVASRLFEEERRFTEMCAESARAADLVGGVDDAYARVRDMAFETVRAVEVALADDAVSKLFEEERRFTEMCAESARAVDLVGEVELVASLGHAALAEHMRVVDRLTARRDLLGAPTRDLPSASAPPRADGTADALPRLHEDIKAGEDVALSADPVFWTAMVLLLALAALASMIDVLSAQPVEAWDNAVLLLRVVDLWEPDPAISGLCKLVAVTEVLRRIWRRRQ